MNSDNPRRRQRRPVTPADSKSWFEALERGESLAQIARTEGRDPRTIRKGIGSVQANVEKTLVRREAMKEALRFHYGRLIDEVTVLGRRAAPGAVPTIENLWDSDEGPWRLLPFEFMVVPVGDGTLTGRYESEGSAGWTMLKSHLGRDPVWRRFDDWKAAVGILCEQMISLKRQLAAMLEEMSGFPVSNANSPRVNISGARQIHEAIVNQAFRTVPDLNAVMGSLQAVDNGVGIFNYLLIVGSEDPESLATKVRGALETPEFTDTVDGVALVADQVRQSGSALATEVEYVAAVPFPGGECRACRRLGQ